MTIETESPNVGRKTKKRAAKYGTERVDALPFNTPEKSQRYSTERFLGATGLNWYECDPTLQRALRYYLSPEEIAWAEPHLVRLGALMGGPISERAEVTDKNPPRLEKYDRWGHDISEVIIPESALETKRDLIERGFASAAFQEAALSAGVRTAPLSMASGYMLN